MVRIVEDLVGQALLDDAAILHHHQPVGQEAVSYTHLDVYKRQAMSSSSPDIAIPAVQTGVLVLVVGPSGAGKDTLMEAARAGLAGNPGYRFARRLITRPAMAGAEDHDSCDEAGFREIEAQGGLALSWQAHGLSYGIPAAELSGIGTGGVVIVNVSRAAIATAERLAERVVVLNITAVSYTHLDVYKRQIMSCLWAVLVLHVMQAYH